MVQQSVWEFDDFSAVKEAVRVISEAGGKTIVFKRSDAVIS